MRDIKIKMIIMKTSINSEIVLPQINNNMMINDLINHEEETNLK